ncbi:MAG: T9SS type A sorting domain-containing protein [Ignavibacteriae bacterium]|nr:T9SS type A sorting domain-containing protein [Ignavibacteria bacterium]MBI3364322.1 T9SS type A sorting domain-containing protein [Ignavibacteriota bacterium]
MVYELTSRLSYPDPFKPSGVEFELPTHAEVTLTLFDQSGREVTTLLKDKPLAAGTHTIDFSDIKLNGEMYFYRLSIQMDGQNFVDTKKIVLTK